MRACKAIVMLLSISLLSGCGKMIFSVVNAPNTLSEQNVIRNIDFGSDYEQTLNVYLPDNDEKNRDVIIFFYGGSWKNGMKSNYDFVANALTDKGYVVVIPDYIKYPKVTFPQWQFDAAKAVAWTLDNIDEYGGDKNNVIIMGHSAGAHIGALLVADRQYLTKVGVNNTSIKGFVGLAGPYHFTPQARSFKQMFGPEENYPLMQVSTFINGSEPPMLLLWGKDDSVVSEQNIINFSASLQQHNNRYEIIAYEDKGHVGMIADFSSWRKQQSKILADIDQFIDTLP